MFKNLCYFVIVAAIAFTSCNQGAGDDTAMKSDTTSLTVMNFLQMADSSVDKPVIIEGLVMHVCKHGGKRLFITDGPDSSRVEILTGGDIAKFDEALIGSRIRVTGTLREERIDAKYLNEWEAEVLKPEEGHETGIHTGVKGHEDHTKEDKLAQINSIREELKSSGKDHLSNFSIEAINYIELK